MKRRCVILPSLRGSESRKLFDNQVVRALNGDTYIINSLHPVVEILPLLLLMRLSWTQIPGVVRCFESKVQKALCVWKKGQLQ